MGRLSRLTAEQEALMPAVRDEWIDHGLSCQPADRAEAERGVALIVTDPLRRNRQCRSFTA